MGQLKKQLVSVSIFLTLGWAIPSVLSACIGEKDAASAAAYAAYQAELVACVADAATLSESRACREGVDKRWGVSK